MKLQKYIAVILLASVSGSLSAQSPPAQEIRRIFADTIGWSITPRQMIASRNGGFLVAGSIAHFGFIAKINDCGDPVWLKTHLLGEATALQGIAELPSGNLMAVGNCDNCAPGDTTRKALAGLFDPGGDLLRDTTLGRFNFNATAYAVISTPEGKAALTGAFVWASFLSPTRAFLTVLDESLQPDFWGEYNELYYDEPRALAQTADGGYVLAGYSSASLSAPGQAQLFRTGAQGQLLWKHTSTQLHSYFNSVQIASDGRLAAFGAHRMVGLDNQVYLAVHDHAGGSLLQERHYGSTADDEGRSLRAVEGGFLAGAAYGEPSQEGWNVRDWIFRLDENYEIADEDFFDSYLLAHSIVNVVPLSPDGRDYAYLSRRTFFESRSVLFYKRSRRGRHLALSQAPQHYQLVPRNLNSNLGVVTYQGILQTPGAYEQARLDVFRNNALIQTNFSPVLPQFSFQVQIPAERANYTFRLSGIKNGMAYPEAEACDVVAGDAYIIQGQSNAVAGPPFFAPDTSVLQYADPFVRNFGLVASNDSMYRWRREAEDANSFADNPSGQWGRVLGAHIAQQQGIPVAILNGGIGGIAIDQMMPNPAAPHSTAHSYGQFYRRMEQAGLRDNVRAVLFFQGETNALNGYNETVQSYQNKYLQLRNHWQSDYDYEREYIFQIRPGCWNGNFPVIQEAQRRLPLLVPDLSIMSATGMNHDGCHYHFENGYERAGKDIYRLIAKDLYQANEMPDIFPPEADSAWFSACDLTQITLLLRREPDTYLWTAGWEEDFRLEGSPGTSVLSGQVSGNTVALNLSAAPGAGFSGLSYVSHAGGAEAPVKNANGIGMLAFYNMPVSMCPVTVREEDDWAQPAAAFPNPTDGQFTLRLPEAAEVTLYDVSGNAVPYGQYAAGEHRLRLDGPPGVYLLAVKRKEGIQTLRLVRK